MAHVFFRPYQIPNIQIDDIIFVFEDFLLIF